MCTRSRSMLIAVTLPLIPCDAHAWEFRARFVERIGELDIPLDHDRIDASSGESRRIRIQFGVFDDQDGPAPAGGFLAWSLGDIEVSGAPGNSQERRTRGRVAPFTFSEIIYNGLPQAPANPNWPGDPPNGDFQTITSIVADLGTQSPFWGCNSDGTPAPMPPPMTWGLNSYVSVYEITINPNDGASPYSISIGGSLMAASEWRVVGTPIPPDCGDPGTPDDDVPGEITYAPFPMQPTPFEGRTLEVFVPAPSGVMCTGAAGLFMLSHRRRSAGAKP